ncbi:cutinase [Xylariales sp. AK1849]|nr:cutinase [Xylariales sp. AK1849]
MKTVLVSTFLASVALASPVVVIQKRLPTTLTENEFVDGGCRDVIFIFARGTSEEGNMGATIGVPLSDGLKNTLGDATVATQGVDYAALISTNLDPGGADPAGITEMADLLASAATECPDAKIVAGGYSQGAAVTHGAVSSLNSSVISHIAGITLFGDTQYQQTGGQISGYPSEDLKIYCATGDLVCNGTLIITAAHLSYGDDAADATTFLVDRINAA